MQQRLSLFSRRQYGLPPRMPFAGSDQIAFNVLSLNKQNSLYFVLVFNLTDADHTIHRLLSSVVHSHIRVSTQEDITSTS